MAGGGDGTTKLFDTTPFRLTKTIEYGDDADNIRLDEANKQVIVGYGNGSLGILDTTGKQLADIRLDAHPESFQLERKGSRVFVNVPKKEHIAVVDRAKRAIVARWSLAGNQANFPMALDENSRRLFVVCRKPARLLVFDIDFGKIVAQLDSVGDSDDVFYDSQRKQIYASGGEGQVLRWSAVALIVQAGAGAILIPALGGAGAAVSIAIGEAVIWWPLRRAGVAQAFRPADASSPKGLRYERPAST